MDTLPKKKTFREQQFELREEAILGATNALLAQKGYDLMAMDDIASEVGIAKGSLYKHFESKEGLAAAVMLRLIRQTRKHLAEQGAHARAIDKLKAILAWTLHERLKGGVPHLPSTSPALQTSLTSNKAYVEEVLALTEEVGALIQQAKTDGDLRSDLSDEMLLYSIYARSCDPTLEFLRMSGTLSHLQIVEQMVSACLDGLMARP
jgi:AcrR family transcriptional regulator